MPYLPLPNFNYDSGPRRIQSGPDHEGYVVLYSGVQSTGADNGFVVAGSPLSGTIASGVWGYDANWRYVPTTLPNQTGILNPTPYNVSGALDTYDGTRIYTRDRLAGAQAASAIGPQTGVVYPRQSSLQPGVSVSQPEKYMYYGGAAPDNQNYSPYNTPDANSAAEGKTGGGVTHNTYGSSLLTNVLGSQGTSDRSQWRYHQPVYCKTYTETKRSEAPGLMSTPIRSVYRGGSTGYSLNYANQLLSTPGLFKPIEYDIPVTVNQEEQIVVGPTPFLWWSYTTETGSLPFFYQTSSIVLDKFANSYHTLIWNDGGTYCIQVIKRNNEGHVIWQKNYGPGVIQASSDAISTIDDVNQILYICAPGSKLHYLLSLDTSGNVRFSKVIQDPPGPSYVVFRFLSLNINPITSDVTLAGSVSTTFDASSGVIITYTKNGNLVNTLTKMSDVTNPFGGRDRSNQVASLAYDNSGNMYLAMAFYSQDDYFQFLTRRNSILALKISLNGVASNALMIGNYKTQNEVGVINTTVQRYKASLITPDNKFLIFGDTSSVGSFLLDTVSLNLETVYTNRIQFESVIKPRGNGEYFICSRSTNSPLFPGRKWKPTHGLGDGTIQSLQNYEFTSLKYLGQGGSASAMYSADVSNTFKYAVAAFGRQTATESVARFWCAGFQPIGDHAIVESGSRYFETENLPSSSLPIPLSVNPTGVLTSGTPFSMYGQGTVTVDGYTFTVNESSFSCSVVDTTSPVWIRLATSGTYDPNF